MPLETVSLNSDWRFSRQIDAGAETFGVDDSSWRVVDLPHDWSIEHAFDKHSPAYCRGAWLPAGDSLYRKRFSLPETHAGRNVSILFDGAYKNAQVYLNGHLVGSRPYGYIAFEYDLTPFVKFGDGANNLLEVKLENSRHPGARWYTGNGIFRDVNLLIRDDLYLPSWRTKIETIALTDDAATIRVTAEIKNDCPLRRGITTITQIIAPSGEIVEKKTERVIGAGLQVQVNDYCEVVRPVLWDVENPALYTLVQKLYCDGELKDFTETRFGIRSMEYDAHTGFSLNGRRLKIKGVCLHNDAGALGAVCPKNAIVRQLRLLKEMGANAVRTAHHPFNKQFLDACDEVGMLVLAEAFDEWREPISVAPYSDGESQRLTVHYYSEIFDQWAERDLRDMVLRDRNHPSIFMWSVGNEVPQMHKPSGRTIIERLCETVKNLDSRPVTCAVVSGAINETYSDPNLSILDVAGYNYPSGELLDRQKEKYPNRKMIATEHHAAQRMTWMHRPKGAELDIDPTHEDTRNCLMAYEEMRPGIDAWNTIAARDFVMGLFIWTGWDYLGEISPYDWPAHSSSFGVIDICGVPKSGFHYYQAQWRDAPVVYLDTCWDWPEKTIVDVKVISNCARVELFLNGASLGIQNGCDGYLHWDVEFEPGELKAVGMTENGQTAEQSIQTSAAPDRLSLTPYVDTIDPEAGEVAFIACEVLDEKSNRVSYADNPLTFDVSGAGRLLALDNGNPFDTTPFQNADTRNAFHGRCLAMVKPDQTGGRIVVTATSGNLKSATTVLQNKAPE